MKGEKAIAFSRAISHAASGATINETRSCPESWAGKRILEPGRTPCKIAGRAAMCHFPVKASVFQSAACSTSRAASARGFRRRPCLPADATAVSGVSPVRDSRLPRAVTESARARFRPLCSTPPHGLYETAFAAGPYRAGRRDCDARPVPCHQRFLVHRRTAHPRRCHPPRKGRAEKR